MVIFIVWIVLILLKQTKNVIQIKKSIRKWIFCNVVVPSKDTRIIEFNQFQKSDKAPCIIYADLDYIIERIDRNNNNPENSSATKSSQNIPSGFSRPTILPFKKHRK